MCRGVIVIITGNGHGDTSSDSQQDCISQSTYTLEKGINPAMGK